MLTGNHRIEKNIRVYFEAERIVQEASSGLAHYRHIVNPNAQHIKRYLRLYAEAAAITCNEQGCDLFVDQHSCSAFLSHSDALWETLLVPLKLMMRLFGSEPASAWLQIRRQRKDARVIAAAVCGAIVRIANEEYET